MKRYSAKLLFQYRADLGNGVSDTMRRCEERLIVLHARSAGAALGKVKAYGKRAEYEGTAEAGNPIYFEFIGVMDLLDISPPYSPEEEVWYDIVTRKLPSERRDVLLPKEEELNAVFWERKEKRTKEKKNGKDGGIKR